jgi:hypothetical protein
MKIDLRIVTSLSPYLFEPLAGEWPFHDDVPPGGNECHDVPGSNPVESPTRLPPTIRTGTSISFMAGTLAKTAPLLLAASSLATSNLVQGVQLSTARWNNDSLPEQEGHAIDCRFGFHDPASKQATDG